MSQKRIKSANKLWRIHPEEGTKVWSSCSLRNGNLSRRLLSLHALHHLSHHLVLLHHLLHHLLPRHACTSSFLLGLHRPSSGPSGTSALLIHLPVCPTYGIKLIRLNTINKT